MSGRLFVVELTKHFYCAFIPSLILSLSLSVFVCLFFLLLVFLSFYLCLIDLPPLIILYWYFFLPFFILYVFLSVSPSFLFHLFSLETQNKLSFFPFFFSTLFISFFLSFFLLTFLFYFSIHFFFRSFILFVHIYHKKPKTTSLSSFLFSSLPLPFSSFPLSFYLLFSPLIYSSPILPILFSSSVHSSLSFILYVSAFGYPYLYYPNIPQSTIWPRTN